MIEIPAQLLTSGIGLTCSVAACCAASAQAPAPRADFYVATDGNDAWSGTLAAPSPDGTDGPFATITRAQEAVRALRAERGEAKPLAVLIRGGTHRLSEPITFGPQDSGSDGAPVTYAAYPGEKPILSGGRPITGWQRGEGELWTAVVPEVAAGEWYFHQLFVNGERRTRARTPNGDYLRTDGPLPEIDDPHQHRGDPAACMGFRYSEGDMQPWANLDDVTLVVYHSWTASLHWIDALDEADRTVRFRNRSGWPIGWWERNQRYYVENYRDALDSPGEWYLDRPTGTLYYWPLPGEDMKQAEVVAPRLHELVRFTGEPAVGMPVEYVTLRGLSLQHADWQVDTNSAVDGQAAAFLEAAVIADGARGCAIEDCEIAHVGEYAVWLRRGCHDNRLFHCDIHDLGAGGVRIGETSTPTSDAQASLRNVIDNSFIHDGGHVFRAGVGVWIGRSSYHEVTHNEICDFDYSGISVGWSWGYAPSSANNNRIEYNHVHHIGRGVLSDMGGIYTLGVSPGTTVRNNLFHDIHSYSYGGWGLYTDEGSTDILLANNIVYNTKTGGFHQHYGKENRVENNILAFSRAGQVIRSRQEEHISFFFERNIVYCDNGQPLGGNWGNDNFTMDRNLYSDVSGEDMDFAGMDFDEWQAKGHDQNSVVRDPGFVDPEHYDFRLQPDSPAFDLGFEAIDPAEIGLYGEPAWVNAPKQIVRQEIEIPRPPPPAPIADDFESTPVGERPKVDSLTGEDEAKGASIRVTDETAAAGQRSLKFTDAAGLDREWQPHMFYRPNYRSGIAHLSLDVRVDEGAVFWLEWRDSASPYRVGPSIRIEKTGQLKANDEVLVTVPLGEWTHLDIECGLGNSATGTYDLTVTPPDGQATRYEGRACGSDRFRRLEWLGFISLATDRAAFYIDNLELDRQQ